MLAIPPSGGRAESRPCLSRGKDRRSERLPGIYYALAHSWTEWGWQKAEWWHFKVEQSWIVEQMSGIAGLWFLRLGHILQISPAHSRYPQSYTNRANHRVANTTVTYSTYVCDNFYSRIELIVGLTTIQIYNTYIKQQIYFIRQPVHTVLNQPDRTLSRAVNAICLI